MNTTVVPFKIAPLAPALGNYTEYECKKEKCCKKFKKGKRCKKCPGRLKMA